MGRRRYQRPSVMKTQATRPSWYFRARVEVLADAGVMERREKTYHLGWCDEIGKREAERKRDEILRTVNNKPLFVQSQVVFGTILDVYERKFVPTLKPNSRAVYGSKIRKYIRPTFGAIQTHRVNAESVQEWVNGMVAAGLSRATVSTTVAVLSSVMKQAAAWEYTQQRDPTEFVRIGECKGKRHPELRALTLDEIRRLLAVCDMPLAVKDTRGQPVEVKGLGDMARIALFCGLRIGEILALTWGCYKPPMLAVQASRSQSGGEITRPKSEAGRRIVALGPVVLTPAAPVSASERIFPYEYKVAHAALGEVFDAAWIAFEGAGWHSLRRSYATMRARAATNMKAAMGHSSEEMSARYVRETFEDDAKAAERMAALIMGEVSGRTQ